MLADGETEEYFILLLAKIICLCLEIPSIPFLVVGNNSAALHWEMKKSNEEGKRCWAWTNSLMICLCFGTQWYVNVWTLFKDYFVELCWPSDPYHWCCHTLWVWYWQVILDHCNRVPSTVSPCNYKLPSTVSSLHSATEHWTMGESSPQIFGP